MDNLNLEWNVLVADVNSKQIKSFNIFNHARFKQHTIEDFFNAKNKEERAKEIQGNLFRFFGSKVEWELTMSAIVFDNIKAKIDVYTQVLTNFDRFMEYLERELGRTISYN